MARALLAVAAALGALAASPAQAATVEVKVVVLADAPVYVAAPGEKNDVLVSRVDDHTQRISDAGANITPGQGCTRVDDHTAECRSTRTPMYYASVSTGDGDDKVRTAGETIQTTVRLFANGGPGNDILLGGPSQDGLDGGGGGHDVLLGGGDADSVADGDTTGVDVDADELDAGNGGTIRYEKRTATVRVDLVRGVFGEAGENDVVRNAASAIGGDGDDALNGDERSNTLRGGAGKDRIVGRGGNDALYGGSHDDALYGQAGEDSLYGDSDSYDRPVSATAGSDVLSGGADFDTLYGGAGPDRLAGGAGDDYFYAGAGADVISCGSDRDETVEPQVFDLLTPGCENVSLELDQVEEDIHTFMRVGAYPATVRPTSMDFVVGCPLTPDYDDGGCNDWSGRLRLRDTRGRPLGGGRVVLDGTSQESAATMTVRLNQRGRRLLARPRGARVVVVISGERLPAKRWTVRLSTQP